MIQLDAGSADSRARFEEALQETSFRSICLVIGERSGALADKAASVTGGRPWREVVWDNGSAVLTQEERGRFFDGNREAAAVILRMVIGADGNGRREPVAWLSGNETAYAIDRLFDSQPRHHAH